jgi:hypothetical protein
MDTAFWFHRVGRYDTRICARPPAPPPATGWRRSNRCRGGSFESAGGREGLNGIFDGRLATTSPKDSSPFDMLVRYVFAGNIFFFFFGCSGGGGGGDDKFKNVHSTDPREAFFFLFLRLRSESTKAADPPTLTSQAFSFLRALHCEQFYYPAFFLGLAVAENSLPHGRVWRRRKRCRESTAALTKKRHHA